MSESDWQRFVDEVITPRFPEGITVFAARGQWRDKADRQVREGSRVVVLLYRNKIRKSADKRIDEIRAEYRTRFNQESVMRLDFSEPVHVRF